MLGQAVGHSCHVFQLEIRRNITQVQGTDAIVRTQGNSDGGFIGIIGSDPQKSPGITGFQVVEPDGQCMGLPWRNDKGSGR